MRSSSACTRAPSVCRASRRQLPRDAMTVPAREPRDLSLRPSVLCVSDDGPSGVAANEQNGGDCERQRAIAEEEQPTGPRCEAVRPVCEREDLAAGFTREVLADCVVPARREDVHQRRNDEEDRSEGCDPSGGVADDRSDPQGENTDEQ